MLLDMLTWLCYGFLYFAVLALWLPPVRILQRKVNLWPIFTSGAILFGLASQQIDLAAVAPIAILGYSLYLFYQNGISPGKKFVTGLCIISLAFLLGAHKIPYFHNLNMLSNIQISQDGIQFTMYLNFDKALVGLLLLGFGHRLIASKTQWASLWQAMKVRCLLFVGMLVLLAVAFGEVHFDPKLPDRFPLWLFTNLCFVCVPEEAFFRGFLQKQLGELWQGFAWGGYAALIVTACLFGFAHYAGGIAYSIWGTIAGLGYGWIYERTKRIEAAILLHFMLNITHFLLFTYPALA